MRNTTERLVRSHVKWLSDDAPESDVAISSRIRLARNLLDFPFPSRADIILMAEVLDDVISAMDNTGSLPGALFFKMETLPQEDCQVLLERHLISRELAQGRSGCGVFVSLDESVSLMVNEEDHLRLQYLCPGLQLKEAWASVDRLDIQLCDELMMAYHAELGFLTACPTNVGTGLRASVMLHLPGLTLSNQMESVLAAIKEFGFAVRGFFGEGTEAVGDLYQISNQSTLGKNEEAIIGKLDRVIRKLIEHERNARIVLLESDREKVLDHVGRAYGVLKSAYLLRSSEALTHLSALRLGAELGMFHKLDVGTINELWILTQPGHMQKHFGRTLTSDQRDRMRAGLVRSRLVSGLIR